MDYGQTDGLHGAAGQAKAMAERLGCDGGILDQIAHGEWDGSLSREQAEELAVQLRSIDWQLCTTRAGLGGTARDGRTARTRLIGLLRDRLPLNRKERYFTGTVLPAIVGCDNLTRLDLLLEACGLPGVGVQGIDGGEQVVEFFTEYGFEESVFTDADRRRFEDRPKVRDTPDVVICGPDWLLAIEAKMYDRPSTASLRHQLSRQRQLVTYWAEKFGMSPDRVAHVALLPDGLAGSVGDLGVPVITWERLAETYRPFAPPYWTAVLTEALDRYDELVTTGSPSGQYADAKLTGQQIVDGFNSGNLRYTYMGHRSGLGGALDEIKNDKWRDRVYEVRCEPRQHQNWFLIEDFVTGVGELIATGDPGSGPLRLSALPDRG